MDLKQQLEPNFLLSAYANGYFPMPDETGKELSWYNPDPRAIIPMDQFHLSKSLKKKIRQGCYIFRTNTSFKEVMIKCSSREETWIDQNMIAAYSKLHQLGFAHSSEIWMEDELVGGLYGVALGNAFFAESKFHTKTDASKLALFHILEHLSNKGFQLFEVQFMTPHLKSLGAVEIPSAQYLELLNKALGSNPFQANTLI